jgi:uncharacterized membrane protein
MEQMNYEFNEQENLSIRKLFRQMNFVGIFLVIIGVLFVIFGLVKLFSHEARHLASIMSLVLGIISLALGIITMRSSNSFKKVVKTEGNDIANLMKAIDRLTTWFSIITTMIIIFIALMIIGFIATLGTPA